MKAIMVMFDTLRRKALPSYGNEWIKAPNFKRLQQKTAVFDNFYAGSLPCIPARRELHTARYNFLHRSWGPLEPFDDSMPEVLKNNGVYTHLVTDHAHYLEDGGATYHNRYNTWECFRGQEGDRWKGHVGDIEIPEQLGTVKGGVSFKQNWVNRSYQKNEEDVSAYKTFEAGIEFIDNNKDEDNWFLQIECFDPHEPFFTPQKYKDMYPHEYNGKHFDWPSYQPVTEAKDAKEHVNYEYAALISMCDNYLGKVLDAMDKNNMWKDTMLIVNTDHGFLLGEHEWWGKNVQPFYDDIVHLPFFIWNPKLGVKNERRSSLTQTIDIAPTILEYFDIKIPSHMQGKSLKEVIKDNKEIRDYALFGMHGGHVNVTDGKHVYMRSSVKPDNKPLNEYTLMPTNMRNFFNKNKLKKSELTNEFSFADNMPILKVPANAFLSSYRFGNKLFDLEDDPLQLNNIDDLDLELKIIEMMRKAMIESEAPDEQYERIGIYKDKQLSKDDLIKQNELRKAYERLELSENYTISKKAKKQLLFLKYSLPIKYQSNFESRVEEICENNNIKDIDKRAVVIIADILLDILNIGDKKYLFIKLIEFADKVD